MSVTTSEAAKLLHVNARTVARWCDSWGLPHTKTHGGWRMIDLGEMVEWLSRTPGALLSIDIHRRDAVVTGLREAARMADARLAGEA